MTLQWKVPTVDGYPDKKTSPCFIEINNTIQIAYWQDYFKTWTNPIYGYLPKIYDDEGEYEQIVCRWAYIPDGLFD